MISGGHPLARLTVFSLPGHRHVPGTGTSPDRDTLDIVKARCPSEVSDANWREVAPYLYGLDLLAAGFFWEAHEVWEQVWLATRPNARERYLLAALIAIANADLKRVMRQPRAVSRLALEAHLFASDGASRPDRVMGFDMTALADRIAVVGRQCATSELELDQLIFGPAVVALLDRSSIAT